MPGFLYNVITQAGAALIAQATAANQIVFVAALSKVTAATSAEELSVQPASWYDGKAGSIAAASATDNVARVVASWQPSGSRQAAKSMCVTARLASQTDAQAVPVIALSDPDSTIELPGTDDTGGAVSIPFLADINASGDVEATPGAAASIADLARFVSLHSAGNPTAGDAQAIYGQKSFKNGLKTDSISADTSSATYITIPRIENTLIKTDYIYPKTDNEKVTFATGIKTNWISPTTMTYVEFTHNVRVGSIGDKTHGTTLYAKTIDNDSSGTSLVITGHSAINDETNDLTAQLTIGRYDSQQSHVGFKFEGFNPDTSSYSSFIVTGYSVGTLGSPVDTIYANKLRNCVLPSFQSGSAELGAILLIRIVSDVNVTLYAGTDITNGQSQTISGVTITPVTSYAAIDVTASGVFLSGGNASDIATGTKWRLMSTAFMASFLDSGITKYHGYALAMRIE